jgi:hypothetical protein
MLDKRSKSGQILKRKFTYEDTNSRNKYLQNTQKFIRQITNVQAKRLFDSKENFTHRNYGKTPE